MRNQIVILAAGKGTRMGNERVPKVLVMLKNKPLILHLLGEVEKVKQLVKPVIVVGYMHKKVEDVLGNHYAYALQEKQLGTGHALLAAKKRVRAENIVVLYGDSPLVKAESIQSLIALHFKSGSRISMLTSQVENYRGIGRPLEHYGRILRDPVTHQIAGVVEFKDASDVQKKIKEVNIGIYMFNTKWLWKNLEKIQNQNAQKEYYLTDIVHIAIAAGETVHSLMIDPKEAVGVNSKEDLAIAEKLV